jgi:putative SOS response-associated peptidase YedK
MAGLYERWRSPQGEWLESCAILTSAAAPRLAALHDRMPVILPPEDWPLWLDPAQRDPECVRALLRPCAEAFELRPVSPRVNRPEHDDPACLEPVSEVPPAQQPLFPQGAA